MQCWVIFNVISVMFDVIWIISDVILIILHSIFAIFDVMSVFWEYLMSCYHVGWSGDSAEIVWR